jgi:D-threonate/D-erythronate kinase
VHQVIAVIADDLTGAAELAGIAFSSGVHVSLHTTLDDVPAAAGVVAIDTETRSLSAADAAAAVRSATTRLLCDARPDWIYKKTDSLLRGPVAAEIEAVLDATALPRCVLVPANPSRGRVVQGGELWVGGRPVHETDLARDPEHPRLTSRVCDLLHSTSDRIHVPDITSEADLCRLADMEPRDGVPVLWAGAADFFRVLLDRHARHVPRATRVPASRPEPARVVLVSGSRAAWQAEHRHLRAGSAVAVQVMPDALTRAEPHDEALDAWVSELAALMTATTRVLVAIGPAAAATAVPAVLAERLATAAVRAIRRAATVERVLAEGGATAAAVAAAFGWTRFDVAAQPAGGVVLLDPRCGSGPDFLIKVGSYEWPPDAWSR